MTGERKGRKSVEAADKWQAKGVDNRWRVSSIMAGEGKTTTILGRRQKK